MAGGITDILDEALKLPAADRAEIAERLISSLDEADPPDEVEAAWQEEIARRLRQLDQGEQARIPWEKVREKLRERCGADHRGTS